MLYVQNTDIVFSSTLVEQWKRLQYPKPYPNALPFLIPKLQNPSAGEGAAAAGDGTDKFQT